MAWHVLDIQFSGGSVSPCRIRACSIGTCLLRWYPTQHIKVGVLPAGLPAADAFARHAEQLVSFMLDDYLLTYLDAAATAGVAGGPSRSPGLLSPGDSRDTQTQLTSSSQAEAAAVWLKAAALKALAAGCVPDSDSNDVPVETQRAAARLAQDLEG